MAEALQETKLTQDASLESSTSDAPSPPPDTAAAVWTRRIIIFSFWAVVASLGLPHWLWTTSIYRSELPVEQMTQWSEGHVSHLVVFEQRSFESADINNRRVSSNTPFAWHWKQQPCRLDNYRT
jgi:hypothetical protein